MVEDRVKAKIEFPFNAMFGLFLIELVLVLFVFFGLDGITFFKNDVGNLSIFISLGMLTFVSVFYGFIFTKDNSFFKPFNEVMKKHNEVLKSELEERYKTNSISIRFLKEYEEHKKALKEFGIFVNPILWFHSSIFVFIINILVGISSIDYKGIILSVLIHLGILSSLFLITSISTIYLAFLLSKDKTS
mgnify:CR=1 FL=1